ncbi:MAG: hypothetical protein JKY54_08225, partial [Flavobacteriales bacterium]|nr:hypothetical protein [Flavobacteriales bacterium]
MEIDNYMVIKNEYAEISFTDGIIYGIFNEGMDIDISGAKMVVQDRKIISDNKPAPLFVDISKI